MTKAVLNHGRQVFADSCAYCHSSKQPPAGIDPQSGDGKAWFRAAVMRPDFLENNFLSNEKRYPLTKIQTNSARALGTNAMPGHIWDNFSSQTYKELPLPDEVESLQSVRRNPADQVPAEDETHRPRLLPGAITR